MEYIARLLQQAGNLPTRSQITVMYKVYETYT